MRDLAPADVLNSVVEITEGRDCERFRRSLCGTIREMIPVDELMFIRPVRTSHGQVVYQVIYQESRRDPPDATPQPVIPDAAVNRERIAEMVRVGHHLSIAAGVATLLLPVLHRDALVEVLVVRAIELHERAIALLKGYTRLFRNFRALIVESERDALTGLLNRRTLDSRLNAILAETHQRHAAAGRGSAERRADEGLGDFLAVLDIDHFKRVNDTLGHLFGDEVLILVTRLMRETFRDEDVLFRFGGEEFVAVLLAHSADGARAALERFRERVATHHFPQLDQVTVSAGFAEILAHDVPSTVVGRSDQALYFAKHHGRNQVRSFEELLARGAVTRAPQTGGVDLF